MPIVSSEGTVNRPSGVALANSTRSRDGIMTARDLDKLVTAGLETPSGESRPNTFCNGILMLFKCGNLPANLSKYEIYK
jgi:hypothetical protein